MLLRNLFSINEIKKIKDEVYKLEKKKNSKNYIWKYYEKDINKISRIEYFVNYNKFLKNLSESKKIKDLIGFDSFLFKDKINFKYSFGEEFKAHQDITANWDKYCNNHITIGIPLQDTNLKNGCLFFAKNPKKKLTDTFTNLPFSLVPESDYKPIETKKGDIIIFDSYIPHLSYINKSDSSRIILYFTYTNKKHGNLYEQYYKDKFLNVPPDIYRKKDKKYRSNNDHNKLN